MTAPVIEFLRRLDVAVLHRVNRDWTLPWLNAAMPVFTDLHKLPFVHWVLVPALAIGWLRWKGRRGLAILLIAISAVGASDMLRCSQLSDHCGPDLRWSFPLPLWPFLGPFSLSFPLSLGPTQRNVVAVGGRGRCRSVRRSNF